MRLLHCLTCQLDWNKNHSKNLISILSGGKTELNLFHLISKMNNVYFMWTNSFFMKFSWMFLLSLKRIFSWITMIFIFEISYLFVILFIFYNNCCKSYKNEYFFSWTGVNKQKIRKSKEISICLLKLRNFSGQ